MPVTANRLRAARKAALQLFFTRSHGAMATPTDVLRSGLNLMRRLPPREVKNNLAGLTVLRPELTEEFLQRVDQPLETRVDPATKQRYIL